MSRFLLLFLFLIWLAWRADADAPAKPAAVNLSLFFGLYLLLIGLLSVWSRLLARRVRRGVALERGFRYFNRVVFVARVLVPVWFAVGVFFLDWGETVQLLLGPVSKWPVQLPGAILGTLPPLIAWAALSWSQFPAEDALREQSMLVRLDGGEPIFRPPSLWSYILGNLRLQVLFTAIPIMLILLAHDTIMLILSRGLGLNVSQSATEGLVTFCSAILVFLIVPEILTRVLPTEPLPASPLRDRMEAMCIAHRLKFRDILLWRTQHRIANALVMGVVPRFRYVLLSDLLLDEMSDEQIEAVFAHEVGHVVHKHLIWYLVFMKILILSLGLCALVLEMGQKSYPLPHWLPLDLVTSMIGFGAFLIAFGFVSRRFERQADVFAARTLQQLEGSGLVVAAANPDDPSTTFIAQGLAKVPIHGTIQGPSHVGPFGAGIFASALEKVAAINNMSIEPRRRWEGGLARRVGFILEFMGDAANNWLHGSIAQRMRTLHFMSQDPSHTHHFDRRMARLYLALLALLLASAAVAWRFKVLM